MSDRIPATGTVHWVGAGLSTGSGLRLLCDQAARVVLWHRTAERAEQRLAELDLTGRAAARAFTPGALAGEIVAGDIVVSMLPPAEHHALLRLAVAGRAHFACSSYASPELVAEAADAGRVGVTALTEAGLDPGIDHLFAHRLVHEARQKLGDAPATVDFVSHCGGVPAAPNDFRYRFSWAPRGVLNALRTPSRYVKDGRVCATDRPWEQTEEYELAGERFEVYPNRDSIDFIERYDLPASWRAENFVRGTLRLAGWRAAWAPVFTTLLTGDQDRIDRYADELAARYPATARDLDRVVLTVALRVRTDEGAEWSGDLLLDVVGDVRESAMARCVSLPLACGVGEILAGRTRVGLQRAAEDPIAVERWLGLLAEQGISGVRDSLRR
jgi:hypothetical protein